MDCDIFAISADSDASAPTGVLDQQDGCDDRKRHGGRDQRLTDTNGKVVRGLLKA